MESIINGIRKARPLDLNANKWRQNGGNFEQWQKQVANPQTQPWRYIEMATNALPFATLRLSLRKVARCTTKPLHPAFFIS